MTLAVETLQVPSASVTLADGTPKGGRRDHHWPQKKPRMSWPRVTLCRHTLEGHQGHPHPEISHLEDQPWPSHTGGWRLGSDGSRIEDGFDRVQRVVVEGWQNIFTLTIDTVVRGGG